MGKIKRVTGFVLIAVLVWAGISSELYRFSHPEKTETQAALHIPKSFVLDFSD